MDLLLQFGWGMMDHSRALIRERGEGTVILSPRDLSPAQLEKFAGDIHKAGGDVLLDPQFYVPRSDHDRLTAHDYWPGDYESGAFWGADAARRLLEKLVVLNTTLGCREFILPGPIAETIDDDWLADQKACVEEAQELSTRLPRVATVALGPDTVKSADQVDALLDAIGEWQVDGIYLVCQHPKGEYLVEDPSWLANVLDIVAGARIRGKRVVLGYCNQQMLIAACAGANAIASGTWMNVRSFPPDKFKTQYEDEIRMRATWCYSPRALSEYKVAFLDLAQTQGVLQDLATPKSYGSTHADVLFTGPQPSTVGFTEQAAFRHFLQCLWAQCADAAKDTFDDTVAAHSKILDDAERLLSKVRGAGIRAGVRDFSEIIDVNRGALAVLQSRRGIVLRNKWATL